MDMNLETHLKKHNIPFTEYNHPAVFTVEESKKLKQSIPGMQCKCLFLKDENEKFYLVALPALKRLNTKNLRSILGVKKLNFGSPEELKQHLNLTPGSVSIFGMIYSTDVALIVDKEIWDSSSSGFHPNLNTSTLVISHEGLKKFYNSLNSEKRILVL